MCGGEEGGGRGLGGVDGDCFWVREQLDERRGWFFCWL